MMKKMIALLTALLLLCTVAAAEQDLTACSIANGTVTSSRYVDVTAPFSGVLTAFDLSAGDTVARGDVLFSYLTMPVYASEAGTVCYVPAAAGDDAAAITARYGGVVMIRPDDELEIAASTTGAYNDEQHRTLHVGETIYFRSVKDQNDEGTARVTMVNGSSYMLTVLSGKAENGTGVNLYRKDTYDSRDSVGKGTMNRRSTVAAQAAGRIAVMCVAEGEHVAAGQKLFEVFSADAAPEATADIAAEENGVVAMVTALSGAQVYRGMLLARLYPSDAMEITAEVDEMDLARTEVGSTVYVTMDTAADTVLTGTVTEVSALGVARQNASYYTVHIKLPANVFVRYGQSASVYIPR